MQSASNRSGGVGGVSVLSWPLSAPTPLGARTGTRIAALAVSDSEETFTQDQVLERLGLTGDEFAEGIFARCGVKRRHLDLSDEFLARTLQGRAPQIEQELMRHSIRAVDAWRSTPRRSAR